MALVAGYLSSAVFFGIGAWTWKISSRKSNVAKLVQTSKYHSVEEAYSEAKKAGPDGVYLALQANTTAPETFKAQFSGEQAIVSETTVHHLFEEREATQTSAPVFGSLNVVTTHSTWHKRRDFVDRLVKGKTLFLSDGVNGKRLIRIPSNSVDLSEMFVSPVGGRFVSQGPTRPDQQNGSPAQGNNNVSVNIVNATSDNTRTIGYEYNEKIIRPNRPVIALSEVFVPTIDDVNNERSLIYDPTIADKKEQPYLYLRPEADTNERPFILTTKTRRELVNEYQSSSTSYMIASTIFLGLGASLLGGTAYYHVRGSQ